MCAAERCRFVVTGDQIKLGVVLCFLWFFFFLEKKIDFVAFLMFYFFLAAVEVVGIKKKSGKKKKSVRFNSPAACDRLGPGSGRSML